MKFRILVILILGFKVLGQAQEFSAGQCLYTTAYNGLHLRNAPQVKSKVIIKLPIGSEIELIAVAGDQEEINGDQGYWLEVNHTSSKGYLFSSFIQEKQIFHYKALCSNWANIKNGIRLNSTLIDSLLFENKKPDEGTIRGRKYNWSNGVHHVEKIYYESLDSDFVIPKSQVDRSQLINLLVASFDYCDCLTAVNKKEILSLSEKNQINEIREFSSIQIKESKDTIKVRLSGGP